MTRDSQFKKMLEVTEEILEPEKVPGLTVLEDVIVKSHPEIIPKKKRVCKKRVHEPHSVQVLKRPRIPDVVLDQEGSIWEAVELGTNIISRFWPPTVIDILEGTHCHPGLTCPCGNSAQAIMLMALEDPQALRQKEIYRGLPGLKTVYERELVLRSMCRSEPQELLRRCSLCCL